MKPEELIKYLTDEQFLSNIHGIGTETLLSCKKFFEHQPNSQTIYNLYNYGIKFDNFADNQKSNDWPLKYIRFAITGKFEISRDQIIKKLVLEWAEYCENITANVNLLIIWQDPSSKIKKADKYNIKKIFWLDEIKQELWIEFEVMWLFW